MPEWYEEPLNISGKTGNLFGILGKPLKNIKNDCFIFIASGVLHRIGPHRLYVKLARNLNDHGFFSFRFDPSGIGDSEGQIKNNFLTNLYREVEDSKFVGDTIRVLSHLRDKYHFDNYYLIGLCGGAVTAILAANKFDNIKAIISIGLDTIYDPVKNDT